MAVLDKTKGMTVEVQVAGVPLQEYPDEEDTTPSRSSNYIEAPNGSQFAVVCKTDDFFSCHNKSMLVDVHIDGVYMAGQYHTKKRVKNATYKFESPQGNSELKFTFTPLAVVEDLDFSNADSTEAAQHVLQGMGRISLKVHLVKINRRKVDRRKPVTEYTHSIIKPTVEAYNEDTPELPKPGFAVAEKVVKGRGITQAVTFTQAPATNATPVHAPTTLGTNSASTNNEVNVAPRVEGLQRKRKTEKVKTVTYLDPLRVPFAHFDFKYRTKAGLQSLYIIPRTPSPAPPEELHAPPVARPCDEMTDEQMLDELHRRRQARDPNISLEDVKKETAASEIKRERMAEAVNIDADADDDMLEVVMQRPVKRQRSDRSGNSLVLQEFKDADVMDLTGDD